jgi:hypothetical protein
MLTWHRRNAAGPILVLALLSTSCADPARYRGAISKFHDATAVVIAAAKTTYTELNQAERRHYADLQVAQRKPIDPDELAKAQLLDPAEIAVRMRALDVLAKFSDLMVRLAANQGGAAFQSGTAGLQQTLTALSGDVDKLTGANSAPFQARAKSVFPLLGTALQAFVNAKTVAAVRQATLAATQPVNDFITILETDMKLAHARERTFLSSRRSEAFQHYRADLAASADTATLRADAASILQLENQWETFEAENPAAGLEAMKRAYGSLTEFVRKPKPSPADFEGLLAEVDSFVNTAGQAGQAVRAFAGK